MTRISWHDEEHRSQNTGWLRAAVMGANDGIVSVACLVLGMASAAASSGTILTAGVAGLVAGAMSMAAGEYVSVSSQADAEKADLDREKQELLDQPELELQELADSFIARGAKPETAMLMAQQLTAKDALAAHAREELGITEFTTAQPMQAAVVSAITFSIGAFPPILIAALISSRFLIPAVLVSTAVVLAILGGLGARAGRAPIGVAVARVTFWGLAAMAVTMGVGYFFGAFV